MTSFDRFDAPVSHSNDADIAVLGEAPGLMLGYAPVADQAYVAFTDIHAMMAFTGAARALIDERTQMKPHSTLSISSPDRPPKRKTP